HDGRDPERRLGLSPGVRAAAGDPRDLPPARQEPLRGGVGHRDSHDAAGRPLHAPAALRREGPAAGEAPRPRAPPADTSAALALVAVSDRIMYVEPGCPYCQAAREGLTAQGIDWEERDATTTPEW